ALEVVRVWRASRCPSVPLSQALTRFLFARRRALLLKTEFRLGYHLLKWDAVLSRDALAIFKFRRDVQNVSIGARDFHPHHSQRSVYLNAFAIECAPSGMIDSHANRRRLFEN